MATFKAEVRLDHLREDNTYPIRIRITHNRKVKRIPTSIYIDKKDVTKSGKIKNQQIVDQLEDIIRDYRKKATALSLTIEVMTIDELTEYLTKKDEVLRIDFFEYADKWIEKHKDLHGLYIFNSMLNSLEQFLGRRKLDFKEINYKFLKKYEEHLGQRRRLSLYMGKIRHLYNQAKEEYNDEEIGHILIPWSPFSRYSIPNIQPTRQRSITAEQVKQIFELPYKPNRFPTRPCCYNIAKDAFILSFCLMGMNSADLYLCEELTEEDGKITISYNRAKTASRRNDNARMSVDIHPFLIPLFEKYRDPRNNKVFSFANRYCDYTQFNKSVNKGLKEIGELIGVDDLEFYAARHSFATIARNELSYDKDLVGESLNHLDVKSRVTDIYIKKDFSRINKMLFEVIDYVFVEVKA